VTIWGDGKARREFIYSEDFSNWIVGQIGNLEKWPVFLNVGNGFDYSVAEYYQVAKEIINYEGSFEYDTSKPTGVLQRLLDSTNAQRFGWNPTTSIREGMSASFQSYIKQKDRL
jgi:GDP-L-fucose synthase